MKAVILAGGLGTRISEESYLRPKPLIEIGGKPILWHIMKCYSAHGINDFVICCGYKGYLIKEYFANYFLHMSDVTFDIAENTMMVHRKKAESWKVTLVDTGQTTQTGGRLRRVREYIENDPEFCLTYGDGLSDVNVGEVIAFHRQHEKMASVVAVSPPGRFGAFKNIGSEIVDFVEKPNSDQGLINGGYFVLSPKCIDLIDGDDSAWEGAPMTTLVEMGELRAYFHQGFWQPMDTLREKNLL